MLHEGEGGQKWLILMLHNLWTAPYSSMLQPAGARVYNSLQERAAKVMAYFSTQWLIMCHFSMVIFFHFMKIDLCVISDKF